ncbi:MAG: Phosphoglycerate mutase [candidate division TM6 bacterium GW2011_GWF2_37_49]|nr:MAG: Phosphoglycerate mutase [candidate division TM6 bacterium GW2011_GWF2_37_49]
MIIILARHGNTFNPGDKVCRVGKRNDLPLTTQGIAQAEIFADALINKSLTPCAIYCSPLQRTQKFAQTIINKMNLDIVPQVQESLNELDYGNWSGLTDEEVNARFSGELTAWKEKSAWPQKSGWPEREEDVIGSVKHFIQNLLDQHSSDDTVLIVSSCGRLRYFLKLVDGAFEEVLGCKGVNVKTGNACKISYQNGKFKIDLWNVKPAEL